MVPISLPALPGSYALLFRLPEAACLAVGRLGSCDFAPGAYLYLGSAHGPGGLRARVAHHLRVTPRPHWHLDWLRPRLALAGGWYSTSPGRLECRWSQRLLRLPGAFIPAPGFGAADCRSRCAAHLVGLPPGVGRGAIEALLGESADGARPVWFGVDQANPSDAGGEPGLSPP